MKNYSTGSGAPSSPVDNSFGWLQLSMVVGVVVVGILVGTTLPATAASAATPNRTSAPAPTPGAGGRVTFGIEPASAAGADSRPNFSFGVTPGATLYDNVALVNYSTIPLSLQLYATDAVETPGGGFSLLPASVTPTGVGAWIVIPAGSGTVDVPAETAKRPGQVVVPFTVQTPPGASPGDHVGGIIASLQTTGLNRSGQKVILDQRIGTRVFIRVSGPLSPKVVLTNSKASYTGTLNPVGRGRVEVHYVVRNAGNVDLSLVDQSVSVSGLFGSKRAVGLPKIPLLLPGASVAETAFISGVWPEFVLHAAETVRPQPLAGGAVPRLTAVTSTTSIWAIPWALLVLVVLIIVALYLLLRARSRRAAAAVPVRQTPARQPARARR